MVESVPLMELQNSPDQIDKLGCPFHLSILPRALISEIPVLTRYRPSFELFICRKTLTSACVLHKLFNVYLIYTLRHQASDKKGVKIIVSLIPSGLGKSREIKLISSCDFSRFSSNPRNVVKMKHSS